MATLFILTEQFNSKGSNCILLDKNGQILEPLAARTAEEIIALQQDAYTILVLPSTRSGLFSIELPRLDARKARAAIPYALEEEIAQPISSMHFAFSNRFYQNKHYLVVATDTTFLQQLTAQFQEENIYFDEITTDWFALPSNSGCITHTCLLVNNTDFKGALTGAIAEDFLATHPELPLISFNNSLPKLSAESSQLIDTQDQEWIAKQLLQAPRINLCQGAFKKETQEVTTRFWLRLSVGFAGGLLACWLSLTVLSLLLINHKTNQVDEKIAAIYRNFFPDAKRVISPRFRISQLLDTGESSRKEAYFWMLLGKLVNTFNADTVTMDDLRFQNETLSMTLSAKDFSALEQLRERLQKEGVNVSQSQASSQDGAVIATMEMTL